MEASDLLEDYIKPLREQSLRQQERELGSADYLQSRILRSLEAIADQIEEWGRLMRSIAQQPDKAMILDAASAIDELEQSLYELDRWLARRQGEHWEQFKQALNAAHSRWKKSGAAAKLASYRKWYQKQRSELADEPEKQAGQRIAAGWSIAELANDLRGAVQSVEEM